MANVVVRYLSFEGRLARLAFFNRGICLGITTGALSVTSIPLFVRGGTWWWLGVADVIASLALLGAGSVSLTVRRLHDLGRSGYHAIWVGAVQVLASPLSYAPTKAILLALPLFAVGLWLTFWPGNAGANRFGFPPD